MKFEVTVTKSKTDADKLAAFVTSGAFVGKERLGTDLSPSEIGEKLAELVEKANIEGLICKK